MRAWTNWIASLCVLKWAGRRQSFGFGCMLVDCEWIIEQRVRRAEKKKLKPFTWGEWNDCLERIKGEWSEVGICHRLDSDLKLNHRKLTLTSWSIQDLVFRVRLECRRWRIRQGSVQPFQAWSRRWWKPGLWKKIQIWNWKETFDQMIELEGSGLRSQNRSGARLGSA